MWRERQNKEKKEERYKIISKERKEKRARIRARQIKKVNKEDT